MTEAQALLLQIGAFVAASGGDPSQYMPKDMRTGRRRPETIDEVLARARATRDKPAIFAGAPR